MMTTLLLKTAGSQKCPKMHFFIVTLPLLHFLVVVKCILQNSSASRPFLVGNLGSVRKLELTVFHIN